MKDKKKIIICAAVAVVIVIGAIVGVFIGKRNSGKNEEVENSTTESTMATTQASSVVAEGDETEASTVETTATTTPEFSHKVPDVTGSVKVDGGVAQGVCTYKGVDYVATEDGVFAVTASGKKKLTSQSAGEYLAVFDDKIYYSAESKTEKEYIEGFEETIDWQLYDGWVMNLDGSGQKKLVEFIGDGFIIYADNNAIYYAESPGPGIYTCGIGYYIYKYDINTGKKTVIDEGKVIYKNEDGKNDIWKESVDNIFFYDDCIYFRHYNSCDGSYVRAAKYNVKTGKKTEIADFCYQLHLAKNGEIYLIEAEERRPDESTREYTRYFSKYSPKNNKVERIRKCQNESTLIVGSDEKNIYLSDTDYDAGTSVFAYYNTEDGYKEVVKKNTTDVMFIKYDSSTGKLIYLDNKEDDSLIKELCNGKEKVIKEIDDYGGYLTAAGEHCVVVDIYISEESEAENDYYKEKIIMLK